MAIQAERVAGTLFFLGAAQFIICIFVAEGSYSGYSLSGQYISDLGIGPSSTIFNSSVILLGLLTMVGTYFLRGTSQFKVTRRLLFLMSLATVGVGVFTKEYTVAHGAVSSAAFFFSGLAAIISAKVLEKPFSLISAGLGVMILVTLGLFSVGMFTSGSLTSTVAYDSVFYLGLGPGGMERMVVYSALLWLAGFSGWLNIAGSGGRAIADAKDEQGIQG
jgi:hypothetical membrane protein